MSDRMSIEEFGSALIMTRDLDPVYVALHGAKLDEDQLHRWLLAYWCFYHMGAASWLSDCEGGTFWSMMRIAAQNTESPSLFGLPSERWPRASERRYFRGPKCVAAVEWLRKRYEEPEAAVSHLIRCTGEVGMRTERLVMTAIAQWPLFGPWIGFKAADMLERCAGVPVNFRLDTGLIYASPLAGIALVMEQRGGTAEEIYQSLLDYFDATPAPPALDRGCGPQEIETILCCYHSYMQGRYWVGKDILEVRHALTGWGETSDLLLSHCPAEVARD